MQYTHTIAPGRDGRTESPGLGHADYGGTCSASPVSSDCTWEGRRTPGLRNADYGGHVLGQSGVSFECTEIEFLVTWSRFVMRKWRRSRQLLMAFRELRHCCSVLW